MTKEKIEKVKTVNFAKNTLRNIRAENTSPFTEYSILLNILVEDDAKLAVAKELSSPLTENNYKPIEEDVIAFVEDLLKHPDDPGDKVLEGLRRGVLAEYVVRDGALFADRLLTVMLKGVGAVMADAYDETVRHSGRRQAGIQVQMLDSR